MSPADFRNPVQSPDDCPYHLDAGNLAGLTAYLRRREWIAGDDEVQSAGPAGDGNMNCTLRVVTTRTSLIVKQGRPWVEKYPQIAAPPGRTLVEAAFYARVAGCRDVADRMPRLVGIDVASHVLALGDCAGFADLTALYSGTAIDGAVLSSLLAYLSALHAIPVVQPTAPPLQNAAMKALNHEHIFALPLRRNNTLGPRLDHITPGLADAAVALAEDRAYVDAVGALGGRYLHGHAVALVHGDYFPGSWLAKGPEIAVIDPEFCFGGAPEFDYGVLAAHLILAAQERALVRRVADAAATAGCDSALVAGFAGVEVMRRLIGVAQLPTLIRSLDEKLALLAESRRLVMGGSLAA